MATRPRSPEAQQEPSGAQLTVSNWPVSKVLQCRPPSKETSEPVAVGHPVAFDAGVIAGRTGSPAPQSRVNTSFGPTQLQRRVVGAALDLPDPDDDAAGEQGQNCRASVSIDPLTEPDAAPLGRSGL